MDVNQALKILGLEQSAGLNEIKEAYRDLAKVWHPDRFQNDPRLRQKAEERFKKINEAYQSLQSHSPLPSPGSSPTQQAEAEQGSELPVSVAELRACGVSETQLPAVLRGMCVLGEAGLAAEDIADAIYSSPLVLDALSDRDYEGAKRLAFLRLAECVAELRNCGVPEDRLRVLSEAGLAVGEIAWAIRNINGLRDELVDTDFDGVRACANTTYEFFRRDRRTRRNSRSTHRAANGERSPDSRSPQESWFEQYSRVIQATQTPAHSPGTADRATQSETETDAAASARPAAPVKAETFAHQFLGIAAVMGVVTLVGLAATPGAHIEHPWLLGIFLTAVFVTAIAIIVRNKP
jgi:hypothetical protein